MGIVQYCWPVFEATQLIYICHCFFVFICYFTLLYPGAKSPGQDDTLSQGLDTDRSDKNSNKPEDHEHIGRPLSRSSSADSKRGILRSRSTSVTPRRSHSRSNSVGELIGWLLVSLSPVCLFVSACFSLSVHLSQSLFPYLSVSLSQSRSLSVSVPVSLSLSLSFSLSVL